MEQSLFSSEGVSNCFSGSVMGCWPETLGRKVDSIREKLSFARGYVISICYLKDSLKDTCLVVSQWKKN